MSSLSKAEFNISKFREPEEGKTVEEITSIPIDNATKQVRIFFERHTLYCIRLDNPADKGFINNLNNFLLSVAQSDKVLDEDLKVVANNIMKNCIDYNCYEYTDEEVKTINEAGRIKKAQEDAKLLNETL